MVTQTAPLTHDLTLTTEQMVFMLLNHNRIQTALLENDSATLTAIARSERYTRLFEGMAIEAAFEAYEASCINELRLCVRV